jgi:hypothetical protein
LAGTLGGLRLREAEANTTGGKNEDDEYFDILPNI